ncbi:hypothetical protein B0J12DRAFT_450837 [Macrophomina phaseolina]|uniref:Uncharacterized protein n=1 Tax=Macrophomina phaseolina TaxID=35725 RepID=A0ABQ8GFE3_9PEZI|nr:hypothetical protein B0J12DRAFT_450837 [Macrophomina phaseolina]
MIPLAGRLTVRHFPHNTPFMASARDWVWRAVGCGRHPSEPALDRTRTRDVSKWLLVDVFFSHSSLLPRFPADVRRIYTGRGAMYGFLRTHCMCSPGVLCAPRRRRRTMASSTRRSSVVGSVSYVIDAGGSRAQRAKTRERAATVLRRGSRAARPERTLFLGSHAFFSPGGRAQEGRSRQAISSYVRASQVSDTTVGRLPLVSSRWRGRSRTAACLAVKQKSPHGITADGQATACGGHAYLVPLLRRKVAEARQAAGKGLFSARWARRVEAARNSAMDASVPQ